MTAQRITISVPEGAADFLARTGNTSQYIANAVEARWVQWQQALGHLLARGWDHAGLVRVLRTLHGVSQVERGVFAVSRALLAQEQVTMSEADVAAAIVLAEEWWLGNKELRRVLTARPEHHAPPAQQAVA